METRRQKELNKKKELSWHHKNIRPYSEKPSIDKQTLVYFEKYLNAFLKELLWKPFEWFLRDLWVCLERHNWPMIRWRRLRWSEKKLQKRVRSSAECQLKLEESVWKILSEKIDQFRWKNSQFCLKNSHWSFGVYKTGIKLQGGFRIKEREYSKASYCLTTKLKNRFQLLIKSIWMTF